MPLGLQKRPLGYDGPRRAAATALGNIACKSGHASGSAGERVDMLIRGKALGGIDGQCMTKSQKKPV